jgi:DNA-binding HxlR family transcriptional regulator
VDGVSACVRGALRRGSRISLLAEELGGVERADQNRELRRRDRHGLESGGPTGFRALGRAVEEISDSMLSDRLSALTNAGLVTRTVDEGPPVSVAYELTDAGGALLPALAQISRWAEDHLPSADQPGKAFGARERADS